MLSLNTLKATDWSRKSSKRVGRWNASKWTFSGRWMNWQNARSWGGVAPWFEWGQTPLFRRMPKLKGFSNAKFKKEYNVINFRDLELLASKWITDINFVTLSENKMIKSDKDWVKLIVKWELKSKFNIEIDKATAWAVKAVEKAWWKIKLTAVAQEIKTEKAVEKAEKTVEAKVEKVAPETQEEQATE